MDIVIKIIGIFFIVTAMVYIIYPAVAKRLLEFFKKGKRVYFAGLVRFVFAVIFLLAARACDIPWVIAAFGILCLISGILVFAMGLDKVNSMIEWYQKKSDTFLRLLGLITLALGAIIIYSA